MCWGWQTFGEASGIYEIVYIMGSELNMLELPGTTHEDVQDFRHQQVPTTRWLEDGAVQDVSLEHEGFFHLVI